MARRAEHGKRVLRLSLRAGVIAAALLVPPVAAGAAGTLGGSVGGGAQYPARALVLSVPGGVRVSVPRIYVTENGKPVDHLSVTPVKAAAAGDFGVVLVIDRGQSMSGAPLRQAMEGARAIAAQRTGNQELGVVTFDAKASVVLPMTSDPRVIREVLSTTPSVGSGTGILAAVTAGLKQLADAHVADGSVIVLSDGAARASGSLTPQSVGAAAHSQHARIFTVGLRDRSFSPGLIRRIAQLGGGRYVAPTGTQLPGVLTHITGGMAQSYLLRYQSILSPTGQRVAVTVRVDGVAALLRLRYSAPAAAAAPSGTASSGTTSTGSASGGATSSGSASAGTTSSGSAPSGAKQPATSGHPAHRTSGATHPATPFASLFSGSGLPASAGPVPTSGQPVTAGRPAHAGIPSSAPSSPAPIPAWRPARTRRTFWTSSLGLFVIVGGSSLLILLAIVVIVFAHPARNALQRRVNVTLAKWGDPVDPTLPAHGASRAAKLLTTRKQWPAFVAQVEAARMRRSPLDLVKRWTLFSVVAAVLLAAVTGSILLALFVIVAAPFAMKAVVGRGAKRQRGSFTAQLPSQLQDLAGAMRAGRSFVGAIAAVADSATEPVRGEFERAVSDERLGMPLEETLEAIGRRMESKDMEQVALIAALHRRSGSNVSEALERVAEGARERADLGREMRALTGQAKMSAWVLTGLPPAMFGALTVIAPSYQRPLIHTTMGIVALVVASLLIGAGWLVMNRIIAPEA